MLLVPAAEFLEDVYLLLGDGAVLARTDVEQQVAAVRQTIDVGTEQHMRCLVVGIGMLVAPRIVHRHAKFPIFALRTHHGHTLLGGGVVTVTGNAAVDDALGGILAEEFYDFRTAPCGGILLPVAVEPPEVGLVLAREFLHLPEIELAETVPPLGVVLDAVACGLAGVVGIVGTAPVEQAVI